MPVIGAERLYDLSCTFLQKAGAPAAIAAQMAQALVQSNLKGMDSHGVIRLPQYLGNIHEGLIVPGAFPEVIQETPTTAVVDGRLAFGHVVADFAMRIALDKGRAGDLAAVTLHNTRHIGRVGQYVEMAVEAGFVGLAFCSAISLVAPYGGRIRTLGTNPIAIGLPSDGEFPFVLDFATSVLSEGKVRLARDNGVDLPQGVILDAEGRPSIQPEDLYQGGTLLPLGAYKGYGLSLAIQILGSLLAQAGTPLLNQPVVGNGALFIVLDPAHFCDAATFRAQTRDLCEAVKGAQRQEGFGEILIPGELEYRAERERREAGIPLAEDTWRQLTEAGIRVGMNPDDFAVVPQPQTSMG